MTELTEVLERAGCGEPESAERLAAMLYEDLRALARREMASERPGHTLQPTALVHEAYLRLMGDAAATFENRGHFYASAARCIRRVLIEHARRRGRLKRGGGGKRHSLEDCVEAGTPERDERLLALDEALERLGALDPDKERLIELRYFGGMTLQETAQALEVSESTVMREWRVARAWLQAALEEASASDGP
jgi:RNA polymerase sigma factor (TIGR02999 family)